MPDPTVNARSQPTFFDGFRLGMAQGNVVAGIGLDITALVIGSAWLAVLGGVALTLGLAIWDQCGWHWTPTSRAPQTPVGATVGKP